MVRTICNLEIYENTQGNIVINEIGDVRGFSSAIVLDECMAEKVCKAIMAVANEIRKENAEEK